MVKITWNIFKFYSYCREFHTTESHGWLAIGYIIATAAVLAVIILSWIIFQKRKRGNNNRYNPHTNITFLTAITVLQVIIYHYY